MRQSQVAALLRLIDENTALFHRLRAVAGDVHGDRIPSAARRGILRSLDSFGPQTVPRIARSRPVSRQHIQMLVNGLPRDGLVVTEENPAHRKSTLLRLTAEGKRQLERMQRRESGFLAGARLSLEAEAINRAADTLSLLRDFLERVSNGSGPPGYSAEEPANMKMNTVEKHFVNSLGHAANVALHADELLEYCALRSAQRYLDVG